MEIDELSMQPWEYASARKRERLSTSLVAPASRYQQYRGGRKYYSTYSPASHGQNQETIDRTNANYRAKLGKRNVGGPFYSTSFSVTEPEVHFPNGRLTKSGSYDVGYEGDGFYPSSNMHIWARDLAYGSIPGVSSASFPVLNQQSLISLGATGIARALPTVPDSPLATAVAELIGGGLPSIVGRQLSKKKNISSVGGEYLNYEFGILPLISDIQSLVDNSRQFDSIIEQTKRDSQRLVRRRVNLADEESVSTDVYTSAYAYPSTFRGTHTVTRTTRQRVWFSGAFRYSYPTQLDGLLGELRDFDRVYGLVPNLSTAWNLLPFSWLVDWQTNVGDVVNNASYLSKNGLELVYGYVMAETSFERKEHFIGVSNDGSPLPIEISCSLEYSQKLRQKANPFGFGVSLTSLTGKQSAILTALGLSRLKL